MRRAFYWVLTLMLGAFFVAAAYAAPPIQDTEKIKILSACRINGEWIFNLFDGVSGKTVSVKMGKTHGLGYRVESFDEATQTASVKTPQGVFIVSMNERGAQSSAVEQDTAANAAQSGGGQTSREGVSTRGTILRAIK